MVWSGRASLRLYAVLVLILTASFAASSVASYLSSRQSIRDGIIQQELPLTADTVYSEIQKDLIRPVFVSSMMVTDTFVRNWVLRGEQNVGEMVQHLDDVKSRFGAVTTFFVSAQSNRYYYADGVLKTVRQYEARYDRQVSFTNSQGTIVLSAGQPLSGSSLVQGPFPWTTVRDNTSGAAVAVEYEKDGRHWLASVRYLAELHWYLIVEKDEGAALFGFTVGGYQKRLEQMAWTDRLTGLANRPSGESALNEAFRDSHRIGVAGHQPGEALNGWLSRADAALYRAKESGRHRVEVSP